jgi:putative oxidoreductase
MDDLGLLVLRVVVGLLFAAHGAQKVFGWWGGPGMAGWRGAMAQMHFRPPTLWAGISSGTELVGGLFLALGFLMPLTTAALIAQSIVIMVVAHLARGFWNTKGGIEFSLTLAAAVTALAATGAGRFSIDAAIGAAFSPTARLGFFALGLAAGIAGVAASKLAVRTQVPAAR